MGSLSRSLRLLVLLGYASVAFMLAVTLILELSSVGVSGVEFRPDVIDKALSVPVAAMVSSSLSLALGWAFLLTGATDCGRRVFLPVAAVFVLQWIFFVGRGGALAGFLGFGGLLILGVVTVAHLFFRRSRRWQRYPLVEFSAWLALMLLVVAEVFWVKSPRIAALDLETALSVPQIFSMPFWVLLGVEAVDGAATLARVFITRLRKWLREDWYKLLVCLILLVHPMVSVALVLNDGGWWGIDFFVSLLLILVALGLLVARRLSARAASLLLAISLVLPVLTLGWSQPFRQTDLTTLALSTAGVATNVLPAALLFVGLAAYDVLNFGVRYANVDGRVMPRGGRVLMYFGVVLLVIAFTQFYLNARVVSTGQPDGTLNLLIDMPFFAGILVLGLPYLAWMAWRRRDKLIGSEATSARSGEVA